MEVKYTRHPLSAAWPDMNQEEFVSLVESIQMHGLRDPIVLLDGQVLDGWHRYRACEDAGMKPAFVEFSGDDPKEFVEDRHNRRSLTMTQRMTAIALMSQWAPSGAAGHRSKGSPGDHLTTDDLAKKGGGSRSTAKQVKAAISKGTKAVVNGMQDGTLSAKRAAEISQLPKKEQAKALAAPAAPKPKKKEAEEREYFGPSDEEIEAAERAADADISTLQALAQTDDKLAAALDEIKRLKAELSVVTLSRDGYMNRSNELIARIKTLKRQLEQAKKETAAA